jgi:hypothetical protein
MDMIDVIERLGRHVNEDSHPETMAIFKIGRDHAHFLPPETIRTQ